MQAIGIEEERIRPLDIHGSSVQLCMRFFHGVHQPGKLRMTFTRLLGPFAVNPYSKTAFVRVCLYD